MVCIPGAKGLTVQSGCCIGCCEACMDGLDIVESGGTRGEEGGVESGEKDDGFLNPKQ